MAEQPANDFVPAAPQLWTYDTLSFLLTSARRWRPALLAQVAPSRGERHRRHRGVALAPSCGWWHAHAHR